MGKKEEISPIRVLGAVNVNGERQQDDYYVSPRISVDKLFGALNDLHIELPHLILEPSVGNGAIAYPLIEKGHEIIAYDIVDRGFPNTNVMDFMALTERPDEPIGVVANYPYKEILEHTKHTLDLMRDGEYLCSLAKIQFLETKSRRPLFDEHPMKYVCVFSERIKCLINGEDVAGSSAICYAWYIWEKGYKGMPMIKWI